MSTKIEWKAQLEAAGVPLPDNWGKMSTSRAGAFTKTALQKSPIQRALAGMATATVAAARAVAGLGSAVMDAAEAFTGLGDAANRMPENVRRPQAKAATMPKDLKWKRSGSALGKHSFYPTYPAPDPEPLTRQVRRQNERRTPKMPIGARQSAWHALMGYGRVGSGKRGASA